MSKLDRYVEFFRSLFPNGKAWAGDESSQLYKFIQGMADEFVRIDDRVLDMIDEADPRTTTEMVSDWEDMLDLPDDCSVSGMTVEERRRQIRQKLTAQYGQNAAFYIQVASFLGYDIEITDGFWSFRAGHSVAGDALTNELWKHWWKIKTGDQLFVYFTAGGSSAGDPLKKLAEDTLVCTMEKLKPAHTQIIYEFGGS